MSPRRVLMYLALGSVPLGALIAAGSHGFFDPGVTLGLVLVGLGAASFLGLVLWRWLGHFLFWLGGARRVGTGLWVLAEALRKGYPTDRASLAQMALDLEREGAGWSPDTVLHYARTLQDPDPPYLESLRASVGQAVVLADEALRTRSVHPRVQWAGRTWDASELRRLCLEAEAALDRLLGPSAAHQEQMVQVDEEPRVPSEVLQALTSLEVDYGEELMTEGEPDPSLVVVARGEVELSQREVAFARVGPGEVVGELAIFGQGVRVFSARTSTSCTLAGVDRDQLELLARQGSRVPSWLEQRALECMVERLGALELETARITPSVPSPWLSRGDQRAWSASSVTDPGSRVQTGWSEAMTHLRQVLPQARPENLRALAMSAHWHEVQPGELLWTQGGPAQLVFLLVSGLLSTFEVHADEDPRTATRVRELHVRQPGDLMGLQGLVGGHWRTTSGALEPVTVLALDPDLLVACRRDLLPLLAERVEQAARRLVDLELARRDRIQEDLHAHMGSDGRPRQILRFGIGGQRGG